MHGCGLFKALHTVTISDDKLHNPTRFSKELRAIFRVYIEVQNITFLQGKLYFIVRFKSLKFEICSLNITLSY